MKLGYEHETRYGPTLEDQHAALVKAGVGDRVYTDSLPTKRHKAAGRDYRRELLRAARPGDEVVVYGLHRLAADETELMDVVRQIAAKGATLYDAEAGKAFPADTAAALDAVAQFAEARRQWGRERTTKGRTVAREEGRLTGRHKKLKGAKLEKAREAWNDLSLSQAEAADMAGVSKSTLRRAFITRGPKKG